MSNTISDPKKQLTTLLEGILLGRTLHDLEKQAGASVEQLIKVVMRDDQASLDFKQMREFSAYVIEDEITERLRANMESPKSAVQNNALKIWADHMHKKLEYRNPAVYSGKAALHMTVPVQIVTDLDLNAPKNIDGIYELEAQIVEEAQIDTIQGPDTEVAVLPEPISGPHTPFSDAILAASAQETEPTALELFAREAGGDDGVLERAGQDPFASGAARFVEDAGQIPPDSGEPTSKTRILPQKSRQVARGRGSKARKASRKAKVGT